MTFTGQTVRCATAGDICRETPPPFHTFHTSNRGGVKRIIARRQGAFHGFHGFHTYSGGCVRDARARPPALALSRAFPHLPLSRCEIREIRETAKKSQDGEGVVGSHHREHGVKWCEITSSNEVVAL